jgi:O-antigen/teichoic acid export membrane protein
VAYAVVTARRLRLSWEPPASDKIRALVVSAAPIAFNTLCVLLYVRASVLMVTAWSGTAAAGHFGAAFTFLQVLQVASGSLASVILPHFVQRESDGAASMKDRVEDATRIVLLGVVPVAATLALLAPEVVQIVYGPRFAPAAPALAVLAWAAIFMFLGSLHGTLLIALNAERTLAWLSPIAAAVSLSANAWLIGRAGIVGASWATLATEALVGIVCLFAVHRRLGAPRLQALVWPAASGGAVAVVLTAGPALPLPVRVSMAAAALAAGALGLRVVAGPRWHAMRPAAGPRGSARA